jgi:hypothetical protein
VLGNVSNNERTNNEIFVNKMGTIESPELAREDCMAQESNSIGYSILLSPTPVTLFLLNILKNVSVCGHDLLRLRSSVTHLLGIEMTMTISLTIPGDL